MFFWVALEFLSGYEQWLRGAVTKGFLLSRRLSRGSSRRRTHLCWASTRKGRATPISLRGPRLFTSRARPRTTSPPRTTGTRQTTIGRCRSMEYPLSPTARYPSGLSPPARLSHRLEGPIKNSGFLFFLCVCLRVGPSCK